LSLSNQGKNTWYKLRNQNLAVFMRDSGFDMAMYTKYSHAVQVEAKKNAIRYAINSLREQFEQQTSSNISDIKRGVYVIRLSGGMAVQYDKGRSPVLYIGQGSIETRLKGHYESKLFEFMLSLNGANFDFYVCEPWKPYCRRHDYHKQIEHALLASFGETFGGIKKNCPFPIMNKISGSNRNLEIEGNWWRKPLKKSGTKTYWVLSPGNNSEFVGALD